ncbi:hypothetical protein BGZ88_005477 [Linnemannia elongata]|nr:hypothetical protein BGZ88_005477 [Linnemannia elongata]
MSSVFTRFLSIPELTAQLEIYLSKHDITVLIRNNRHLSAICTPLLYSNMCFLHSNRFDFAYFDVKDNITRNLRHIQYLSANADFIHTFYDIFSGSSPLSLDQHEDEHPILSIIRGNPGLTHIHLENVRVLAKQDLTRLTRVVTALPSLQSLVVSFGENLAVLCGFSETLFFGYPSSIKQLKIVFKEQHLSDSDYKDFEDTLKDQNRTLKDINDNMDEETTLFPTRNPLSKLRSLLEENMLETTMLEIGNLIATLCPKLEILLHSPAHLDNDGVIFLGIMETLPPQSLTELHLKKFNDAVDQ